MYEESNLTVDHNKLLMDLMDRVGRRHRSCGCCCTRSLSPASTVRANTTTGRCLPIRPCNLLSPGKQPGKNLLFLTFFMEHHPGSLQVCGHSAGSAISASNDHRLGANEAPPAIVSVFIGQTSPVLDDSWRLASMLTQWREGALDLLSKIPNLELDNTDRNRTSPCLHRQQVSRSGWWALP